MADRYDWERQEGDKPRYDWERQEDDSKGTTAPTSQPNVNNKKIVRVKLRY